MTEAVQDVMTEDRSATGAGYRLEVRDIVVETEDARSIVFAVPPEAEEAFRYRPGQFLTVRVVLPDGSALARCYSLSSTPGLDDELRITVKRIADGRASAWLVDELRVGDRLDVLPPTGLFTVKDPARNLILFAAGSGITPVMSILRDALANSTATVTLCYANRDERSVIFASELRALAAEFPDRLAIVHVLGSLQGRASATLFRRLAQAAELEAATAFVCGPASFMDAVEGVLRDAGMPREHIVSERFRSLAGDPFADPDAGLGLDDPDADDEAGVPLTVDLDGEHHELKWSPSKTLLDQLRAKGIEAPFSCREGACSACACKLLAGRVTMANNQILEQEDLDEGWVLGCQAVPEGDEPIAVTYDD